MDPFVIMTKWFWAVCILVMFLNAGIFKFRAKRHIQENPDLADGYRTIIRGWLIYGNIPWIVMGLGSLVGGVPSIDHFFRPRDGNPFVLAFFASVFQLWILSTYWIFFRRGAEMLVDHPGIFNVDFKSPIMVKLFWLLCLAGGIAGVTMMFIQDIPITTQ